MSILAAVPKLRRHHVRRIGAMAYTLAVMLVIGGSPVIAQAVLADRPAKIDLLAGPLPADEPEAARGSLTCELADADLCELLIGLALDLEFSWHRVGYMIRIRDGSHAPASDVADRVTGRARAEEREIEVFIHWTDTVIDPVGAFRGVKRTLAHELGHAMHQTCGEDILAAWRETRSIPDQVPTHGHGFEGHVFHSVAEDFAESAMAWLTGGEFQVRSSIGQTRSGGAPTHVSSAAGPPVSTEDAASFFIVCP